MGKIIGIPIYGGRPKGLSNQSTGHIQQEPISLDMVKRFDQWRAYSEHSDVKIIKEVTLPEDHFEEPKLEQTIFPAFYQSHSKELFKAVGSRPENWCKNSQLLKFGADVLFEKANKANITFLSSIPKLVGQCWSLTLQEEQARSEMELGLLYFQLSGSSIELLLKGIIIARQEEYVTPEGKLKRAIKTHDLTKLLGLADISVPVNDCSWSQDYQKN